MRGSEFQSFSLGDPFEPTEDLAWIEEEGATFWTFAAESFQEAGRGVIALGLQRADLRATAAQFYPMLYVPAGEFGQWSWQNLEQLVQMVKAYDPNREFILVLMKPNWERVLWARVAEPSRPPL